MNWIGLIAALSTFLGIWLGHVLVRKIDYVSPTIWMPSLIFLLLGVLLELGAALSPDAYISASLGIFGVTLLWDALEFWRQHKRIKKGHAPANPANPRHAQLLNNSTGQTTSFNWLERNPQGQRFTPEQLKSISESE